MTRSYDSRFHESVYYYDDEALGAYVDGELDPAAAEALEAQIPGDAELRRRIAELRHINLVLRASYMELARPQTVAEPVLAHAQRQATHGQRSRVAAWRYPAIAASIALLL